MYFIKISYSKRNFSRLDNLCAKEKYTTVSKRLNYIDRIQEHKLQKLLLKEKVKEYY